MRYDNSQLVHVWAQQNETEGKNGNGSLSFHGESLRSYSTEIARFIEGKAIYTTRSYSTTTSTKHQTHIPSAVRHVENYRVTLAMNEIPRSWDDAKEIIFGDMLKVLKEETESLLRSRSRIEDRASYLAEKYNDALRFFSRYISTSPFGGICEYTTTNDQISIKDLFALSSNVAGFDFLGTLQEKFGAQLKEKIAQNRQREKERKEKLLLENMELMRQWRNHENSRSFHNMPIMLRVSLDGQNIETSRGARISTQSAIMLHTALINGVNIIGKRVEHFTVSKLTEKEIVIGCHNIPLEEIRKIAASLQLSENVFLSLN